MTIDHEQIHGAGVRPARPRPVLHPLVTLICWIFVGLSVLLMAVSYVAGNPLDFLDDPVAAVRRVGDRSLDLNDAIRSVPSWERWLYSVFGGSPDEYLRVVADAYGRALDHAFDPQEANSLRARQAILFAESDAWERAEEVLAGMDASAGIEAFRAVVTLAYGDEPTGDVSSGDVATALQVLATESGSSWASDRLAMRVAERSGAGSSAEHAERIQHRAKRLLMRARALNLIYAGVLLGGLIVVLRGRVLFRRGFESAAGLTVAPWPFPYGMHVLARCYVCSAMVLLAVLVASRWMFGFASLLMGLPVLIVAQYFLFRPEGDRLFASFGLGVGGVSWKSLLLFTAALIFVSQCGALIIVLITHALGIAVHIEEGIDETILFGHPVAASLLAVDGIVTAPFVEEIGFRGLLYVTLRARFRPLPAACISAGCFGTLHLYSLPGLLTICWTGFILALAYERSRSLWPCVLAHAFNNFVYFAELTLLYR